MLLPDIFVKDALVNDFFNFPMFHDYGKLGKQFMNGFNNQFMKTDIKETDDKYEARIDLPGIKKEDISIEIEDDTIIITAKQAVNNDEKDANGKFIRKERYEGQMQRSFTVGENVDTNTITAKLENGVLCLDMTKKTPSEPEKKTIQIEG